VRTSGSRPASRSSSQRRAVRRSCQTSAWCSGSPVRLQVAVAHAGVVERLDRDGAGDVPDLGGVVLDPARSREVLAELAVGAAGELRVGVEDEARGPRRPLVDREDHRGES
jgi:hypothetical protein